MTMLKKKWLVECQGAKISFTTFGRAKEIFMKLQERGLDPSYPVSVAAQR